MSHSLPIRVYYEGHRFLWSGLSCLVSAFSRTRPHRMAARTWIRASRLGRRLRRGLCRARNANRVSGAGVDGRFASCGDVSLAGTRGAVITFDQRIARGAKRLVEASVRVVTLRGGSRGASATRAVGSARRKLTRAQLSMARSRRSASDPSRSARRSSTSRRSDRFGRPPMVSRSREWSSCICAKPFGESQHGRVARVARDIQVEPLARLRRLQFFKAKEQTPQKGAPARYGGGQAGKAPLNDAPRSGFRWARLTLVAFLGGRSTG